YQRMSTDEKGNSRRNAGDHLVISPRHSPFDATQDQHDNACHQHRPNQQAQSLEDFKIGVVGHSPCINRTHGLISEHWKNVSKSPVSVSDQGSRKDGSYRDYVERHTTLVAQAFLRDFPDNGVAEN